MANLASVLAAALALVCGASQEPGAPSGDARMRTLLALVREAVLVDDFYVGRGQLERLRERLAALPSEGQPARRARLLRELGQNCLRVGELEQALEHLGQAAALRPRLEGKVAPDELDQGELQLALAWMRWGETQNCVALHTSESCLLPIRGSGVHADGEGSRRAMEIFARLLERHPEHLATRWCSTWPP